jgi:predicted nucleotidyltransferase component of viral defense system
MIKEWLEGYKPKNNKQAEQALREIMQVIALAGLQRSGFFEKAAFYGGTALRIFHELPRFSEDLDFSLIKKNPKFSLQPHLDGMLEQFESVGMRVRVAKKDKYRFSFPKNEHHMERTHIERDYPTREDRTTAGY